MNDWRGRLTRWFTPLARRCPISPNTISVLALLINCAGALCVWIGESRPIFFLVSIGLISFGGLADAMDGVVARTQGKETRFGDFLDHVVDRIGDGLLAGAWLLANDVAQGIALFAVGLTMLNGYVGTQLEATYRHRNYDSVGRGEFVLALVVYPIISYILATNGWRTVAVATLTIADWLALIMILFAVVGIAQRIALARRLERAG